MKRPVEPNYDRFLRVCINHPAIERINSEREEWRMIAIFINSMLAFGVGIAVSQFAVS